MNAETETGMKSPQSLKALGQTWCKTGLSSLKFQPAQCYLQILGRTCSSKDCLSEDGGGNRRGNKDGRTLKSMGSGSLLPSHRAFGNILGN